MENPLHSSNSAVLTALLGTEVYSIVENKTVVPEQIHSMPNTPIEETRVSPSTVNELSNAAIHYEYLGENNKYILLLVDLPLNKEILKDQDLLLIEKTLAALKLEIRDVAIVNLHQTKHLHFKQMKDFFSTNKVVAFGIDLKKIGIQKDIPKNTISQIEDCPFLLASSLDELRTDQAQKVIWWSAMKSIF